MKTDLTVKVYSFKNNKISLLGHLINCVCEMLLGLRAHGTDLWCVATIGEHSGAGLEIHLGKDRLGKCFHAMKKLPSRQTTFFFLRS